MKNAFVFDICETDIADIPEASIVRDTGVQSAQVKKRVMAAVSKQPKPVRSIRKIVFSMIAAAAAIAVIGTVTVGAAGGFNAAFGEFFAGSPANGVYSGSNLQIKSDQVAIDFCGIAGDDDQVMAMMKITNKDGSPFTDTADQVFINDFFHNPDYAPENEVHLHPHLWGNLAGYKAGISDIHYTLKDSHTLYALIDYQDDACHVKGERLHAQAGTIYAFRPVRTLYTFTAADNDRKTEIAYEFRNDYTGQLSEKEVITLSEDLCHVIVAEKTDIPLDFELDVTLNYQSATRTLPVSGKTYTDNETEWTVTALQAKSFTLQLSAQTWELQHPEDVLYPDKISIVLNDGSSYTAIPRSLGYLGGSSIIDTYGEFTQLYDYIDAQGTPAALDPDCIASVTCHSSPLT